MSSLYILFVILIFRLVSFQESLIYLYNSQISRIDVYHIRSKESSNKSKILCSDTKGSPVAMHVLALL